MPIGQIQYLPQPEDPFTMAQKGLQLGASIRGIRDRRALAEQQAETKKQYSIDLQGTMNDPTPENIARLTIKYPGQKDAFKQGFDVLTEDQKKNEILTTGQAYSAMNNNQPEIAKGIIQEQITASENSGKDTTKLKNILSSIDKDPNAAKGFMGIVLSSLDPDNFSKNFATLKTTEREEELQAPRLKEAKGKADVAAIKAGFAESEAALGIAKKGWDITKIQNDIGIAKENAKIATAKSALDKESNQLKKDELALKIKDMETKRDAKANEVVAAAESGMSSIDNMLNSTERFFNTADDVIRAATGPVDAFLPTLQPDVADFEELVETMSSQAFMAMIPSIKGTGSLSDAEGKKLATSMQSLSMRQSPKRLKENVKEIQRILGKARTNLANKYGVKETIPDTPAAELTTPEIDELLLKYGDQ